MLIEKLQSPENQFAKPVVLSNIVIRYRVACAGPNTVQQTASDLQNKQATLSTNLKLEMLLPRPVTEMIEESHPFKTNRQTDLSSPHLLRPENAVVPCIAKNKQHFFSFSTRCRAIFCCMPGYSDKPPPLYSSEFSFLGEESRLPSAIIYIKTNAVLFINSTNTAFCTPFASETMQNPLHFAGTFTVDALYRANIEEHAAGLKNK